VLLSLAARSLKVQTIVFFRSKKQAHRLSILFGPRDLSPLLLPITDVCMPPIPLPITRRAFIRLRYAALHHPSLCARVLCAALS
jgi:hypothetical protein